jgi:hypothetical protein
MTAKRSLPPFLLLPIELRYDIYDYLCGSEPRSYPFKTSPVSSIDQTPPPTALQLACRDIYEDIQTYFRGHVTLRFVAVPYCYREIPAPALQAIRFAKKIDIVLVWHLTPQLAEANMSTWPKVMHGWLARTMDLLLCEAKSLELVMLSVRDASHEEVDWELKRKMLAPLQKLPSTVMFSIGEVASSDAQEEQLKESLNDYLKELNARGSGGVDGRPKWD